MPYTNTTPTSQPAQICRADSLINSLLPLALISSASGRLKPNNAGSAPIAWVSAVKVWPPRMVLSQTKPKRRVASISRSVSKALDRVTSQNPLVSMPSAQRLSRWRCSTIINAGASCAACASRANFSLSHNHRRPSAPPPPANSKPSSQPSSIIKFSPSRLPSAQNTFTGRLPSPSAATASPAPLIIASNSMASNASRAPCIQCPSARNWPSRSASISARACRRSVKSPPAARTRRLASLSSSGPVCSSRRRIVSVSHRRLSLFGGVEASVTRLLKSE